MKSDKENKGNIIKVVSEELKRKIVEEIESGSVGQCEASRLYGINRTMLCKWLKQYGRLPHQRQIVEVVMKDEREKIEQLQGALADAQLKIMLYEKMMDLASSEYKIDLKKNYYFQASEALRKQGKKSHGCAQ